MAEKEIERMKKVVEWMDDAHFKNEYGDELESIEESHQLLAEAYFEVLTGALVTTLGIFALLLLYDTLMHLDSIIYGLTINAWAALFILYPSLRGRYMVAGISENIDRAAIRRIEIRRGVFTLVGWGLMALGFGLQVLAHQVVWGQLLTWDVVDQFVTGWIIVPYLIIVFYFSLYVAKWAGRFATQDE